VAASDLTPAQSRIIGLSWRWRMEQEHLAVSLFSQLAAELSALGCQRVILEMITKAAADEVRHTDACATLARRWLVDDAVPAFLRGAASLPAWPGATREQLLALHMVETCCVSETLTAAFLTEMLERTTDAGTGDIVRGLLADELEHARVGWAYLRELQLRGIDLGFLGQFLPAVLDRQVADIVSVPSAHEDVALEACGYLGPGAAADLYRAGVRDIVLPGFAELGIDLG
jgi:hypothetical protein